MNNNNLVHNNDIIYMTKILMFNIITTKNTKSVNFNRFTNKIVFKERFFISEHND